MHGQGSALDRRPHASDQRPGHRDAWPTLLRQCYYISGQHTAIQQWTEMNASGPSITNHGNDPRLNSAEKEFIKMIANSSQIVAQIGQPGLTIFTRNQRMLRDAQTQDLGQYHTPGNVRCGLCFPGALAPQALLSLDPESSCF